jgi:hypothetical protein
LKLFIYFSFPDSYRGQRKVTKERAPRNPDSYRDHPTLLAAQPHIPGWAALFVDVPAQKCNNEKYNKRPDIICIPDGICFRELALKTLAFLAFSAGDMI